MPAPTERQITNQTKRRRYATESFTRTETLVRTAITCPCSKCISAAHVAAEGTKQALTDARLWEGRLYGSDRRYPFTLRLNALDKLVSTIPRS